MLTTSKAPRGAAQLLGLYAFALVALLGLGRALVAGDMLPARNVFDPAGGIYVASPATLVDGEKDALHLSSSGRLLVSTGAGTGGIDLSSDVPIPFSTTSSNGTTIATLVTAVAATRVYPLSVMVTNTSATDHTVTVVSATTGTVLYPPFKLAAGSSVFLEPPLGSVRTLSSEGLGMKIDSGGTGTDVQAAGFVAQK